ncbi:hypothetical protein [Streptomyces sp. NPDC001508]|uniref:hypothetical protein n=1 Tax=Streptomyces sp. NPDC001508 TaxID=3154656 RepID=UPI00331B2598
MTVRLRQTPAERTPQGLRDGALDLAVAALDAYRLHGLSTRLPAREEMVPVTAPGAGPGRRGRRGQRRQGGQGEQRGRRGRNGR